jgi:hypothetical protein
MRPINILRSMAVAAAVVFAPSAMSAQMMHKPLSFTVFGGASVPTGDAADAFNTGYTVGGAMDLRAPVSPFGLRAEAGYSSMSLKSGAGISGKTTTVGGNLNAVLWTPSAGILSPYLTAGGSYAHYNFGEGIPSEGHYGFNAGAGLDFSMGLPARIDLRYVQISADGSSFKTVPITFGIRF